MFELPRERMVAVLTVIGVGGAVLADLVAVGIAATLLSAPYGAAVRPMQQAVVVCVAGAFGAFVAGPCCLFGAIWAKQRWLKLVCWTGLVLGVLSGPLGIVFCLLFKHWNGLTLAK